MKPSTSAIIVLIVTIFILNVNPGRSQGASSYSNQYQGSDTGYRYPSQYSNGESNELSNDKLSNLFDRLVQNQKLRLQDQNDHDLIFSHDEILHELEFSYDENDPYGPSRWKYLSLQCGGSYQSPVHIDVRNVSINENSNRLIIDSLDIVPENIKVENNGHSMKLTFNYQNNRKIYFSGGPLSNPYILDNIHFHWGSNGSGSEHVMNGKRYAAEVHLVTYNSIFESIADAAQDPNGLAVLGILYDLDPHSIEKDNPWVKFISKVIKAHSSYTENKYVFPLRDLVKYPDFRGILSYRGSLTTPGCSENVLWMLSSKPIPIQVHELYELTKLRNAKGRRILINYRPLQNLNGRTVTAYRFY